MEFYKAGRTEDNFEAGIRRGLEWILASPSFLFRIEREPAAAAPGSAYRSAMSSWPRACRSSSGAASRRRTGEPGMSGKLSNPAVLDQQVRRMLRDARSKALVDNFATRWLELSKLPAVVLDTDLFSDFEENLRDAMAQETKLFVADQLRTDRSVVDLLTADYTFLNDRLARHYGIPDVYGNHFRRVTLPPSAKRGGLLGHASILALTSYPNRTSVVVRGKWVLANLSVRLRLRRHPTCRIKGSRRERTAPGAARADGSAPEKSGLCHLPCADGSDRVRVGEFRRRWDLAGGERRRTDRRVGVSAGRHEIRRHRRPQIAARHSQGRLCPHLHVEAAGLRCRGAASSTPICRPVRKIVRDAAAGDYRWSAIISGIVNSTPFRMGMARGGQSVASRQSTVASRQSDD
jgi:hypothetical protein